MEVQKVNMEIQVESVMEVLPAFWNGPKDWFN